MGLDWGSGKVSQRRHGWGRDLEGQQEPAMERPGTKPSRQKAQWGWFPPFGYCEQCYEHTCTGF